MINIYQIISTRPRKRKSYQGPHDVVLMPKAYPTRENDFVQEENMSTKGNAMDKST